MPAVLFTGCCKIHTIVCHFPITVMSALPFQYVHVSVSSFKGCICFQQVEPFHSLTDLSLRLLAIVHACGEVASERVGSEAMSAVHIGAWVPSLGRGVTRPARGILQPLLAATCRAPCVQEGGEQNGLALVPRSLRSSRREGQGNCGVRGVLDQESVASLGVKSLSLDTREAIESRAGAGPRRGQLVGA